MGSSPRARDFTVFGVYVNIEAMIYKILSDRNQLSGVGNPAGWAAYQAGRLVPESPHSPPEDHLGPCTIF
jgi:hypothetical protein